MPIVNDIWGNDVEITNSYVSHRNRLIDVHQIHTFQTKGKRLYINTYKQNQTVPTMCIFFDNKEKAQEAYQAMKEVYYGPLCLSQKQQPSLSTSDLLSMLFVTFSPLLVFLFLMLFASLPVANASVLFLPS